MNNMTGREFIDKYIIGSEGTQLDFNSANIDPFILYSNDKVSQQLATRNNQWIRDNLMIKENKGCIYEFYNDMKIYTSERGYILFYVGGKHVYVKRSDIHVVGNSKCISRELFCIRYNRSSWYGIICKHRMGGTSHDPRILKFYMNSYSEHISTLLKEFYGMSLEKLNSIFSLNDGLNYDDIVSDISSEGMAIAKLMSEIDLYTWKKWVEGRLSEKINKKYIEERLRYIIPVMDIIRSRPIFYSRRHVNSFIVEIDIPLVGDKTTAYNNFINYKENLMDFIYWKMSSDSDISTYLDKLNLKVARLSKDCIIKMIYTVDDLRPKSDEEESDAEKELEEVIVNA